MNQLQGLLKRLNPFIQQALQVHAQALQSGTHPLSLEDNYQNDFRTYATYASKGLMDPQMAINRINSMYPMMAQTTSRIMGQLMP